MDGLKYTPDTPRMVKIAHNHLRLSPLLMMQIMNDAKETIVVAAALVRLIYLNAELPPLVKGEAPSGNFWAY